MDSISNPSVLRISEAARKLRVSTQTVRNYVERGWLEADIAPWGERLFDPGKVDACRARLQAYRENLSALREQYLGEPSMAV